MVVNDYFYLHHPLGEWSKMLLTTIHYEGEILSLPSARILVAYEGKLLQFDTPAEIVKNPADSFVRSLIEAARSQEEFWENVR